MLSDFVKCLNLCGLVCFLILLLYSLIAGISGIPRSCGGKSLMCWRKKTRTQLLSSCGAFGATRIVSFKQQNLLMLFYYDFHGRRGLPLATIRSVIIVRQSSWTPPPIDSWSSMWMHLGTTLRAMVAWGGLGVTLMDPSFLLASKLSFVNGQSKHQKLRPSWKVSAFLSLIALLSLFRLMNRLLNLWGLICLKQWILWSWIGRKPLC